MHVIGRSAFRYVNLIRYLEVSQVVSQVYMSKSASPNNMHKYIYMFSFLKTNIITNKKI